MKNATVRKIETHSQTARIPDVSAIMITGNATMVQKLNVLVTGGAGYIGSHAVLALIDAGHRPFVIDNLLTGFRWAVAEDAGFYQGDISDSELVESIIRDEHIDAIMHFAGSVVVPESVENPLKYYNNNTAKSRSLIETAISSGDIWHSRNQPSARRYGDPAHQSVWNIEIDD
jgi:UDP-glucose 4-epimerase